MWPRRTYRFCPPGSPTDVSLQGDSLPRAHKVGRPPYMYATAVCDHSGVVILGGCHISLGCSGQPPTVLATSRHELLRAYTGEAEMLKRNCFGSVAGYSRTGGDGGCVADL